MMTVSLQANNKQVPGYHINNKLDTINNILNNFYLNIEISRPCYQQEFVAFTG